MLKTLIVGIAIASVLSLPGVGVGQELSTDAEAAALCNFSHPGSADEADAKREIERRKLLHRRFSVTVDHHSAPVIGYDELSGVLAINAYIPLKISNGHALELDGAGAIPFEVTPDRAQEIVARYETEQARLRIEFVPAPFADSEQPICSKSAGGAPRADGAKPESKAANRKGSVDGVTESGSAENLPIPKAHIHGALLKATIVDPLGRPLATFETSLGREIELMKSHNISGFLASAYPQVTVSSVSFFDGKPSYPRTSPRVPKALDRSLRSQIQKRLYGCYVRGLASNARLQGALVVRFDATEGAVATVMVDSLNSPAVVGCVAERLGEIGALHAGRVDGERSLKVTLIFKLKDNSL